MRAGSSDHSVAARQRRDDLGDALGVPAHARRVAVDLEQDQRLDARQAHRRAIQVDGLDAALVQDLDGRRADARRRTPPAPPGRPARARRTGPARSRAPAGSAISFSRRRVTTPSVPSAPTMSLVSSRPADDCLAREPTEPVSMTCAVRQDHFEAEHPGAGRAVLDRAHAVGVGRGHAADGRHAARAGIGREDQAVRRERCVQLGVDDARLAERPACWRRRSRGRGSCAFSARTMPPSRATAPAGLAAGRAARRDRDAVLVGVAHDRADVARSSRRSRPRRASAARAGSETRRRRRRCAARPARRAPDCR